MTLPKNASPAGDLVVLQAGANIAFSVRRVYFIHNIPERAVRGGHAHKRCHEVVIAAAEPAWHLFTLRGLDGRRDRLQELLQAAGVGTGIYYPVPPHPLPAYAQESASLPPLPICGRLASEILSLPLHPHLSLAEADIVTDRLAECLAQCR